MKSVNITLYIFTLMTLVVLTGASADLQIYEFTRNASLSFPGKRLVGHVFEEFSTKKQVIHCAYECLKSSRCHSFNYERELLVCQLNDGDHLEFNGSLITEVNGTSYEYHHRDAFSLEQEALGPCAVDPCENGGRCLDTVNWKMERTYFCICTDEWMGHNCETPMNRIDWDDWEEWGTCSATCETGWTTRRRRCMDVVTGETMSSSKCYGREVEYKSCTLQSCPRWLGWSEWDTCTTADTCGQGTMQRYRNCSNGGIPGKDRYCLGFTTETAPCKGINCRGMLMVNDIVDHGDGRIEIFNDLEVIGMSICADSNWNYSEIDVACKQIGFQGAFLDAVNNNYNMSYLPFDSPIFKLHCAGKESTIQQCRRELVQQCDRLAGIQCRVRGGWSLWTGWGECSVTCENGTRTRTRECDHPPPNYGGTDCPGEDTQFKPCTKVMCPRNGTWGEWGKWSGCDVTCGEGERLRYRPCADTVPCVGTNVSHDICVAPVICPVDGVWATWSPWSECDVTCENGTRFRTRTCTGPFYNGAECPGPDNEVEACFPKMCPVDGVWDDWVPWTACSHTCGYGNRNRSRTCHGPFYDGMDCQGSPDEIETCNAFSCPVDGDWKLWTNWGNCSVSCGGGLRNRTRECIEPEFGGATCIGASEEAESCNEHNCPIDGVFSEWELWSECSVTCANGTRFRDRECFGPYFGGANCTGPLNDEEVCVTAECPVDGVWDSWQPWQECNVTCGGGRKLRQRACIGPYFGGAECEGSADDIEDCNTHECPVDGEWELWSSWETCNVTCGGGSQRRNRNCHAPLHGGDTCSGRSEEWQECNTNSCPVDGEWETWMSWSSCNVSCGGGVSVRQRSCHQPMHGGADCGGDHEELKECGAIDCPVDGIWELWSNWTECTLPCGSGIQTRNRTCTGPFFGGADCIGDADQLQNCNEDPCPIDGIYGEWAEWSTCSLTCGRGSTSRNRTCFGPYFGGAPCDGPESETTYCFPSDCPVHGLWNPWTVWTDCSTTCENGTRTRNRTCDGPYFGGDDCDGAGYEIEKCFLRWCPVDGVWEEWTAWDTCPVTCGGSVQNRTRNCIGPFHDGANCTGPTEESQDCNIHPCPVDGDWTLWTKWNECNVTCGGGTSGRFRFCSESAHGGSNCTGPSNEFKDCNTHECPIDGLWEAWSNWTECTLTCGTGERQRFRDCDGPFYGGANCTGPWDELENCNTHECPVDGEWGSWKVWSSCSKSCGSGEQLRVRVCFGVLHDGLDCTGPQQEIRECNIHECPVDGVWEEWASWSACNVTCGGGTRWRSRDCEGPLYGGAECPGQNISTEACNTHECPIDGVWADWTVWEECSVTCGGGNQSRFRNCTGPFYGGANCTGAFDETRDCNTFECPIDGVLSEWSEFYACDVQCGGGIQWRNRTCIGPFYGGANCTDPLEESRECNSHNCPINGVYNLWSSWEECDVTCGGGIQWRNRTCDGPYYGGVECEGPDKQNQTCNDFFCPVDGVWEPWTDWDECSVMCGGAVHSRYRNCTGPFYGGAECPGPADESRDCNTHNCPVDGVFNTWGSWYECNVTCGGGMQWRNRSCEGPFYGGADCAGPFNDSQACNTHECPVDGVWEEWQLWQDCSETCGGGIRLRDRVCDGPFYGGAECEGPAQDSEVCGTALCPIPGDWFPWSEWTLCTVTCNGGVRYRNRTCDMESYGNLTDACQGPTEEIGKCHTFDCLPRAMHCADWASRGLNQSCIADVDPDGEESVFEEVQVECDFDTEPGKAVTIIHHDQENTTQVQGYEAAGMYEAILIYTIGWGEAIQIVEESSECAQYMRWDCKGAIIHNPYDPTSLTTYWKNRTEEKPGYFGGATPGSGNCACGETNSCANASLPCNCDSNDNEWRYDDGFVTNKAELPIHSFYAGDTGGSDEDGYATLGPLLCSGLV